MKKQEQEVSENENDEMRFLFISESLALDLVNTEMVIRRKRTDRLETIQDVHQWWQAAQAHHPEIVRLQNGNDPLVENAHVLEDIKTLRAALRRIFSAIADEEIPQQADLDVLNDALSLGYHQIKLNASAEMIATYTIPSLGIDMLRFIIALFALRLINEGDHKRIHRCGNNHCILLFYDTTRSATRRWCSQGCMDRARSAKRYQQSIKP